MCFLWKIIHTKVWFEDSSTNTHWSKAPRMSLLWKSI
ncbi:hypothetical protein B4U80_01356 [Leptotrombidium deliense]|uniref:Uncharacterized protein n=1 Tax=Leptotrombidium deliense TaxID=299467 RepID=A0A443RUK9_9ACAR|nr:hypothetical protein B4U80_01356 [Leptotrombidium deliense]